MVDAILWRGTHLDLLDQRILPFEEQFIHCHTAQDTATAIRDMVVRGAPAIGVTAAYGMVLALKQNHGEASFRHACEVLAASRPTAVNLFDAIELMQREVTPLLGTDQAIDHAEQVALKYHRDDLEKNKAIGRHGASFLSGPRRVLTHCNTGSLATAGWGTALGIVRQLHAEHRLVEVVADETRPYLQGARLTVWECAKDGIPHRLVTDGMGGYLMTHKMVDCVIVGADRIAANGDAANKIGTFMLAMAAKHHGIPFVVAAPTTTIDRNTPDGSGIPIEQRPEKEVTHARNEQLTCDRTLVYNPAFDVTPASLISAIVTEDGVHQYPYRFGG
ncbi:MAG: S-methyl-5-thioribose-1-phosphate isomerase [Acidobacteria bacterium]|nr:S-methyl-5-thioribose-1-phosphate isomerase [Acidobacteriota bacterium]